MRLAKKTAKIFGCAAAAMVGLTAAMILFMSLMIIKVEDSSMLPALEPGSIVIAVRTPLPADIWAAPSVKVGDMVVFRTPYYEIGSDGIYHIRRVSGLNGDMIEVCCDEGAGSLEREIMSKKKILGKVIYNG